jgi:LPXTG-motif cell wall-anchored protein
MAQPDLANVLLYHVVSGKVMSTDLSDGLAAPTLYGEEIVFDLSDGVKANASNVIAADVEASNGVVHVIDSVLVPSDFVLQDVEIPEEDIPQTGDVSSLPLLLVGISGLASIVMTKKRFSK